MMYYQYGLILLTDHLFITIGDLFVIMMYYQYGLILLTDHLFMTIGDPFSIKRRS